MSQQFRTVTTNAGRNAVREALAQGKSVKLSHMSVGDGGGSPVTPTSAMTALVNERFRAQINDIALDPATPDLFTAELFIPQAEGGFYIREVGLWTEDGTLFAVGNTPLTEKPDLSSGAATDLLVRLIIRVLDAAAVAIEIDPTQVLATRDYVDRKLDAHNRDGGAHETLARKRVQIKAGTGLSGGGTLEANRTLDVTYGNTAGTACQGNDVRLSDTRTPKAHKDSHKTGGTDALLPEEIGAARGSRISATTPATAGWYRIAQSAASISNCMGLFEITGAVSGAHSVSLIAAGLSYGKAPGLIQLAHAPFATPAITKARIVYHPTYSGNFAYLEVYLSQAKAISLGVNLLGGQGWTLVAPSTAGAVPSGYSVKELTLAEGKIVGDVKGTAEDIAIGGNAGDLASQRGQIGTPPIQEFTKKSEDDATLNLNDEKWWINGEYALYLRGSIVPFLNAVNNTPVAISGNYSARLRAINVYYTGNGVQEFSLIHAGRIVRKYYRSKFLNSDGTTLYFAWHEAILTSNLGDGILNTNGIISVPMATDKTVGLVHGDGMTVVTDNGVAYAKDIAIGGDAADLASERGQIGTPIIQTFTATTETGSNIIDLNDMRWREEGEYNIYFNGFTVAGKAPFTPEKNNVPLVINYNRPSRLVVKHSYTNANNAYQYMYLSDGARGILLYCRSIYYYSLTNSVIFSAWQQLLTSTNTGDGITVNNGIISVPEMEGATASAAGVSGLVPPANAGEQGLFLTGGGSYKSAITKITDSVTSTATDTAASAKAVKAAYDKAVAASLIAPGDFVFSYKASKTGFLLCNGAAVSRTTYANLFAAIGTKFGAGDGSTTFNLPDARNRVLQGASGNLGAVLAAGLPNITGRGTYGALLGNVSGAFYTLSDDGIHRSTTNAHSQHALALDASRSNAIYGKSSTVQPPALALNCFIKY